jgi:hypothetical protein
LTFKSIIASFCDEDYDLDIFRIVGFFAYAGAIFIAFKTVAMVESLATDKLLVLTGLVASLSTVGTLLFSQARKGDKDRIDNRLESDNTITKEEK